MSSEGTPLHGDRSAWNVMDFDTEHAKDIMDSTLQRHLPLPGAAGGLAQSDGTDWQRVNSIALADLPDYTINFIIVGGASDWEAAAFDWDTMAAGAGADMVHAHTSNAEGGTITVAAISDIATTYLKLDASNDPITGALQIEPSSNSTSTLDVNQSDGTAVLDVDTINRRVVVTSGTTGQSTIEAGLIVNNASGGGAINDFQVNSDTLTAIFVDASLDRVELNGGLVVQTSRQTTTYTILVTDQVVFCDTDGGAFTATLPAGIEGQTFKIANTGTSSLDLTIAPNGAELLIGVNSNFILRDGESLLLTYNTTEGWN